MCHGVDVHVCVPPGAQLALSIVRQFMVRVARACAARYKLREITSTLDVLCSFAEVAAEADTGM